ncbi:MAG: DUF2851 family protein [Crocinitomicaceae bacterium]
MKEDYLHFLWRMRCLPSRTVLSTDKNEIEIIDFGEYNSHESGPDFLNGKLLIDGILWVGSIEFHLKASDWYKHGHQDDAAYNNVILHVVWEKDQEVFCQGRNLITLVLAEYISDDYAKGNIDYAQKNIELPCSFSLSEVNNLNIEKQKEAMIYLRLTRKTESLKQREHLGFSQVLYELLATAFGAKVNRDPFWQLSRELPIKRLLKMNSANRATTIYAYSGLGNALEKKAPESGTMKAWQWKKKGLLPNGFPEKRVKQFAHFVQHFDFDYGFLDLPAPDLLNYLLQSFSKIEYYPSSFQEKEIYSKSFRELIILNSFVPFLFWLGETRGEIRWQNRAFELLILLPAENNHILQKMKQAGFELHSAYDSQAVMELNREMCTRKKCLTCAIGNEILKR